MGHYDNCRPENCGVCGQLIGYCEHTKPKEKNMIEVKAPNNPVMSAVARNAIFLAGSIEQGKAENWQERLVRELENEKFLVIYNPRRENWDPTLEQTMENETFNEQVTWELNKLEKSNVIPMYFQPGTKSPITLLELGLFAYSGKLIVCCPEGFWRKGNVDIVCRENNIQQVDTLDELVSAVKENIQS